MTPLELLKLARKTITAPSCWTKGKYARDAADRPVQASDPSACQWCASGALYRATSITMSRELDRFAAETALREAVPGGQLVAFNDISTVTHAEVLDVFDRAIAKLETAA